MSADGFPNGGSERLVPTFVTKAELADYLEDQASEIQELADAPNSDPQALAELAGRLAEVARSHGLNFLAEMFERLMASL